MGLRKPLRQGFQHSLKNLPSGGRTMANALAAAHQQQELTVGTAFQQHLHCESSLTINC